MTSRWILNLLLLGAVAALALVAYYQPGQEGKPAPVTLTALQPDQVRRIHIERRLRPPLELQRTAQGWVIERQPPLPADDFQIKSLTRLASQEAVRSYAAAELDAAALQLDPPASSVTLDDIRLDFGTLEPLDGLRYVKVGERILLIPDLYQHLIDADYTRFVRRRLFAPAQRIEAIELPGLALEKTDGRWSVKDHQDVSSDEVQRFVERWQDAAALTVRPMEEKPRGDRIQVRLGAPQRTVTFIVTRREPELVLARPDLGIQYQLGNQADSLLQLPPPPATDTGDQAPL